MTNILDKITNKFQDFRELMKGKREFRRVKNNLLKQLTISELEKVYKNYISTNLYKEVSDYNTQKITKVKLNRKQLSKYIFNEVNSDQIYYMIKRLKK